MDKNLHNIEDLFKKGLEGNEDVPSEKVWDEIDKRLDKETVINIKKKYRRLQQAAVALLIFIFAAVAGIYFYNKPGEKGITASRNKNIFNNPSKKNGNGNGNISSSPRNHILKSKDSLKIRLTNDSIPEKQKLSSNSTAIDLTKEKLPAKKNKVFFENDKESSIGSVSKRADSAPISFNKKLKKDFTENEFVKDEKPGYGFKEKKHQSIIAFYNPDFSKKLSLMKGDFFKQEMNPINKVLINSSLIATNKSLVSNKIKMKPVKKSRISLTTFYSPNITFYNFQKSQSAIPNPDDPDDDENNVSSWTAGGLIDYSFNKHWNVESGLAVSTTNIDLAPETIYAQPDNNGKIQYRINTTSGYGFILPSFNNTPSAGDSVQSYSTSYTSQYLEIPLSIKYNINKGRFIINARAGLAGNILTKASISTEVESSNDKDFETTDKIHGLKPFYLSCITGVGLDYNVYKKWWFSFFPSFRFALNSINKDLPLKTFPNSLGFSLGIKMEL